MNISADGAFRIRVLMKVEQSFLLHAIHCLIDVVEGDFVRLLGKCDDYSYREFSSNAFAIMPIPSLGNKGRSLNAFHTRGFFLPELEKLCTATTSAC